MGKIISFALEKTYENMILPSWDYLLQIPSRLSIFLYRVVTQNCYLEEIKNHSRLNWEGSVLVRFRHCECYNYNIHAEFWFPPIHFWSFQFFRSIFRVSFLKFLKTCLNEMVDFGVCSAVRPIVAHFSLVSYCAAASIQFSKSDENAIRSDFNSFWNWLLEKSKRICSRFVSFR